jgi:[acyl-carrier-protein] S-malonyltransferase
MSNAHIFTGQGFNLDQVPDYSSSKFFKPVSIVFEELFKKKIPSRRALGKDLVSKNEISTAILLISSLENIEIIRSTQPPPSITAGYSIGQLIAMHYAGCISQDDLVSLVFNRCLVMNEVKNSKNPITLAAVVGTSLPKINNEIYKSGLSNDIYLTNDNAMGNYTFAVPINLINIFFALCKDAGAYRAINLKTDGGWHSPYMVSTLDSYLRILDKYTLKNPLIPIIDNTYSSMDKLNTLLARQTLCDHMIKPVQWRNTILQIFNAGTRNVIEITHFDLLTRMSKLSAPTINFSSIRSTLCAE